MRQADAVIIGGGPAGLAAAVELYHKGITDILILERESSLGGILKQCIHDGFGLSRFGETLSGPEYAQRFIDQVEAVSYTHLDVYKRQEMRILRQESSAPRGWK